MLHPPNGAGVSSFLIRPETGLLSGFHETNFVEVRRSRSGQLQCARPSLTAKAGNPITLENICETQHYAKQRSIAITRSPGQAGRRRPVIRPVIPKNKAFGEIALFPIAEHSLHKRERCNSRGVGPQYARTERKPNDIWKLEQCFPFLCGEAAFRADQHADRNGVGCA